MSARHTKGTPLKITNVRPMTRDDVEALQKPSARVDIQTLRDSHHNVARLLASGLKYADVAAATGYSHVRIATLATSPAMKELVAKYRTMDDQSWKESRDEYYASIHAAGAKAWRQINDALDRADEENEPLPVQRLIAIADSSADRVGYNKKSTTVNINVDFAQKLEAAIARSRQVKTIELEE